MSDIKAEGPEKSGVFYGWVVVLASFAIVGIGMGTVFSFGVYLKPLHEHFAWSRAQISLTSSINWMTLGAFSLVFGFLSDRIGARKVVFTGGLFYGAGLLLASRVEEVWQLYISVGVMTGVGMGSFYVPLTSTAARWFDRRRGVAVATVTSGSGLGVLILSPSSRFLIDLAGWRWAYAATGLIVLGVVLPLSRVLRNSPQDVGLRPLGMEGKEALGKSEDPPATMQAKHVSSSLKTSAFWALTATHFLCCISHSGPIFHMVAFATDVGIPKMAAAGILGVMGISSTLGRIGTGHLADKTGTRRTLIVILSSQAGVIFLYLFARHMWDFYLLGILFGLTYGGVMPVYALIASEYFGPRIMGTIYGGVFLVSSVGMGLGSYLGGYAFDVTGSYIWLLVIASLASALAAFMASTMKSPGGGLWQERLARPEPALRE